MDKKTMAIDTRLCPLEKSRSAMSSFENLRNEKRCTTDGECVSADVVDAVMEGLVKAPLLL